MSWRLLARVIKRFKCGGGTLFFSLAKKSREIDFSRKKK
jgi:hypothetical protein